MRQGARGIQSIEVSGRILRALAQTCGPMMLKDLAQAADLAPAQCHAYLTSLRHVGLVRQDPATGHYRTGAFALRLGIGWMKSTPQAAAAVRELKALTEEFGVMSLLAVWGAAGPTIIHFNAGVTQTALNIRQGTLFSVTGTATGRVFAAFGTTPEIEQHIDADLDKSRQRSGIGSILTRADFDRQRDTTRARGFATAEGGPVPGLNAVAAPIFGCDGQMRFVGTLIGPTDELNVGEEAAEVRRLLAVTGSLSARGAEVAGSPSQTYAGSIAPADREVG
ncbi:IclR family transcriptional regulator [Pseudodonghicola flavimaris]|uniref:Helix-turn-helix domain-containing protein n=1 Tax=Pseudodonghicola flavimaris TaxID=3050036 RepID=A0ABT7F1P9_9RHOB|nr:helix-turn-helix domain-containing protein [Pseudodonghicola flavimaris]MDK3018389.1 helix-turn-helix domain-containing protein [Pseudodonghicola flavimaris]